MQKEEQVNTSLLNESEFEIIDRDEIAAISESNQKNEQDELEALKAKSKQESRVTHNSKVLSELKIGDLIEFKRDLYSHWAVFIGKNKIIHLYGTNDRLLSLSGFALFKAPQMQRAEVIISDFWDIVKNSYAYRNNSMDNEINPLPVQEILIRAYNKVGTQSFDLFSYNCEHFAKHCRYGLPHSGQIMSFLRVGNIVTKSLRDIHENCSDLVKKRYPRQNSQN